MNNKVLNNLILCLTICWAYSGIAATVTNYDFCSLPMSSSNADPRLLPMWNAATVHQETARLATSDQLRGTPLAAYPTSYVAMTEVRDQERCGGSLAIPDRQSRLIGDLLADLMSRWLVLTVEECEGNVDDATGLCGSVSRTTNKRLGTLESALDMTAVYLSSHMATALLAVTFDDVFWSQEFPASTHCSEHPCSPAVMRARVDFLKRYKKYYDLNNKFLSSNISTVAESLKRACLIKGPAFEVGARIAERLPFEGLFKTIRDETFAAVLGGISAVSPDTHPMLKQVGSSYTTQFAEFKLWDKPPQSIIFAERKARALLSNMLLTSGLSLLGSRSPQDLAESVDCQPN